MNKHAVSSLIVSIATSALLLSGCKDRPIDRLVNPIPEGDVAQTSGVFTIYDDELKTGGGLGFIPGGENQQINLNDRGAYAGLNAIRYSWNGGDVFNHENGELQHLFAGFSLLVSPDFARLSSTPAKDLSAAGYTALRLYVRGSLSPETVLRIEGPAPENPADDLFCAAAGCREITSLSGDWQLVEIPIPADRLTEVKSFLTVTFQYTQPGRTTAAGGGGEVFIDEVRYVR